MIDDLISRKAVLKILTEERVESSILVSPAFTEMLAQRIKKLRHFPMRSHDKGLGIDLAYLAISGDGDLALKTGKRCMSISWNKQFRENGSMYRDTNF